MPGAAVRALSGLLLAGWLGLAADTPRRTLAEAGDGGGAPPLPSADGGARAADGGAARDPDQDVIDHLDELEQLELLQHLGLLDPSGEDVPPAEHPETSPR